MPDTRVYGSGAVYHHRDIAMRRGAHVSTVTWGTVGPYNVK